MAKPRIPTYRNLILQMVELIKKLSASCTDTIAVQQSKELVRLGEELLDDRTGV